MALYLRENDIARLLPMADAIDAVEAVFRRQGEGGTINIPRSRVHMPGGVLHVMSGGVTDLGMMGLKTYATCRGGARFVVLLFSTDAGELLTIIEADQLGQIRTGAASGVATKHMARQDAAVVGVIGTGWQARSQLAAVCAVRNIERVVAYSRDEQRRKQFCDEMTTALNVPVAPVATAEEAARGIDVIITITNAREPVLYGAWISPGTHINAAGSNALIRSEIDVDVVKKATLITVDAKDQAKLECGDLLGPIERGVIHWGQVRELGEVVAGRLPGRRSDEDITLFESQGLAIEDVAVAALVYERAKRDGVGETL